MPRQTKIADRSLVTKRDAREAAATPADMPPRVPIPMKRPRLLLGPTSARTIAVAMIRTATRATHEINVTPALLMKHLAESV
jgi:hypothetical protein